MSETNWANSLNGLYGQKDEKEIELQEVEALAGAVRKTGRTVLILVILATMAGVLAGSGLVTVLGLLATLVAAAAVPILNLGMKGAIEKENTELRQIEAKINRELLR